MESLIKFKEFVNEINNNNSRNYKLSILEKYKEDEDIRYFLNYIFNPYIITGISDKKLHKPVFPCGLVISFAGKGMYKAVLNYIARNNTGTDETLYFYHYHADRLEPELKELLDKVVTKNLQLGIDTKSINKVIPNLIPVFNVQLANKYFDKPEVVEGKTFAITTKIDGMRCIMMKEKDKVTFWSRQGQPIEGLVDLEKEALEKFPNHFDFVLDGELVAAVDNPDTYKDTMKRARTKDNEKHGLKMKVFDYLSLEDFKNQDSKDIYLFRRADLLNVFTQKEELRDKIVEAQIEYGKLHLENYPYYPEDGEEYDKYILKVKQLVWTPEINKYFKYFEMLPLLYRGKDTSKIIQILNEQTAKGEEGIMINIVDAKYEFKRSNSLLKVKKFQDTEVKVIGFEQGTNQNQNRLGALICDYKGNELRVGGGYSEEDRKYIWNHQDEYLGEYIKVKYFEETTNANGGVSLRFPTYLGLRDKGDM